MQDVAAQVQADASALHRVLRVMLVLLGGQQRTESEWRSPLAAGGFTLVEITPRPATNRIETARA